MTTRTNTAAPAATAPTAATAATAAGTPLSELGFSAREGAALQSLRRRYVRGELNEISIEHRRLEFARWLVQHGRLTDYLADDPAGARGAGQ
ncbi:MAG TPA: hypothetical protein VFX49_22825 [Chloroflexota bacterium]|nr:hypothetical protein [Chloroflexota bacterium]